MLLLLLMLTLVALCSLKLLQLLLMAAVLQNHPHCFAAAADAATA